MAHRNRDYEREIPPTYLAQINALYDDWAQRFALAPLCVVEADALNWAEGDDGLDTVADVIAARVR